MSYLEVQKNTVQFVWCTRQYWIETFSPQVRKAIKWRVNDVPVCFTFTPSSLFCECLRGQESKYKYNEFTFGHGGWLPWRSSYFEGVEWKRVAVWYVCFKKFNICKQGFLIDVIFIRFACSGLHECYFLIIKFCISLFFTSQVRHVHCISRKIVIEDTQCKLFLSSFLICAKWLFFLW